ncbi:MAG: aminomethyltransferase family protein [Blautia sp.]|jgi:aminomethyltransferase
MYYKNVYKYDEMKRAEHMAVRNAVGWYFFTHHLVKVTGADAAAFLDKMFANPIANLKPGRERYTTMLNEEGQIIDDVVIFRHDDNAFWISTLFAPKLIPWFDAHKGDMDVSYENITSQYDMYAVQGPKSANLLNQLLEAPVDDMKFFSFASNTLDGIPVIINRAGFTGEAYGYEIYISPEHDEMIEKKLTDLAKELGGAQVTEFQIMAMTLPTEKGFYYMRDLQFTNPFEVGLDKGIGWDKDFIGKEALLKIKEEGPAREMVGFTVAEPDIHINHKAFGGPGEAVLFDGEEVGRVSKITYSYLKDTNIGYILAKKGALKKGDVVTMRGYEGVITDKVFA